METFNLNIIPGKTCPVCHASQYDIGRTIRINLFENAAVYTLDGTETISVSVRKTDGNVVTASVTNTSDNYVEIVTTEQMTACHGANLCELKIEKGADVIGTMNFILEVEQDPLEGGIASQSEIDNLATQVAAIVADQYDSNNVIFDAAPTPGHGIGYTVTSEGIGQAIDDAVDDLSDTLAPVATSGSYNDLTDTPSLVVIDDVTASVSTVYSSNKVEDLLALKQNVTDSNLQTTAQTVVGAINELNTNLENSTSYGLTEKVIGDFFGTPLYRQGFVLTNITVLKNSNYTKALSDLISGNIRVIDFKAIARVGTQYFVLPYTYSTTGLSIYSIDVAVDNEKFMITRGNSNDLLINDLTIIIDYIKVI